MKTINMVMDGESIEVDSEHSIYEATEIDREFQTSEHVESDAELSITLKINGKEVKGKKGDNLLQAARKAGVDIPTLCYHDDLEPYGACRLCMVEVEKDSRKKLVAACCYQVEDGLEVNTKTEEILHIRKVLIEFLMAQSPSGAHATLAKEYGIKESRFKLEVNPDSPCTLCGLCVRYCNEIIGNNAVTFTGRGIDRNVALVPGVSDQCISCKKCFDFCDAGKMVYMVDHILG